jgi:hypothetical protein
MLSFELRDPMSARPISLRATLPILSFLAASACGGHVSLGTLGSDGGARGAGAAPVVCGNDATMVQTVFDRNTIPGKPEIADFVSDGASVYVAANYIANFQAGHIYRASGGKVDDVADLSPRAVTSLQVTQDRVLFEADSGSQSRFSLYAMKKADRAIEKLMTPSTYNPATYGGSLASPDAFLAETRGSKTWVLRQSHDENPRRMLIIAERGYVGQVVVAADKLIATVSRTDDQYQGRNVVQIMREAPFSAYGSEPFAEIDGVRSRVAADSGYAYLVSTSASLKDPDGSGRLLSFPQDGGGRLGSFREVARLGAPGTAFRDVLVDDAYIYVEHSQGNEPPTIVTRVTKADGKVVEVKRMEGRSTGRRFAIDACNFYWSDGDKIYSQPKSSLAPN